MAPWVEGWGASDAVSHFRDGAGYHPITWDARTLQTPLYSLFVTWNMKRGLIRLLFIFNYDQKYKKK